MTHCVIDNENCMGASHTVDLGDQPVEMCQYHARDLSDLGERGFREWYSIELDEAGL